MIHEHDAPSQAASNTRPINSSLASTKNFFVRYMSRNAAQNGFSDQATPMLPTATVICPSGKPSALYMRSEVPLITL